MSCLQQEGEKLPRTQGFHTALQQHLFITALPYRVTQVLQRKEGAHSLLSRATKYFEKKLEKDKQMGTRWKQNNPGAESMTFMVCKAFFVLQSWPGGLKKKKTKKKKKRKKGKKREKVQIRRQE